MNNYTYDFVVRGYECGSDEAATLYSVMNYLQDAAGRQAIDSKFSRLDFEAEGLDISWVLTKFHLQLKRYPRWNELLQITTWPCNGHKITVERDFELRINDELIGRATSEWVLIDLKTRKLTSISERLLNVMNNDRPRAIPNHVFSRLKWTCQATSADAISLRARRGDIDINGHVNNAHYAEWLIEALPVGAEHPCDFEICYKSETLSGDEMLVEAVESEPEITLLRIASPTGIAHALAKINRNLKW